MTLAAGARLGPYEVAIKVLPRAFAQDAERDLYSLTLVTGWTQRPSQR